MAQVTVVGCCFPNTVYEKWVQRPLNEPPVTARVDCAGLMNPVDLAEPLYLGPKCISTKTN